MSWIKLLQCLRLILAVALVAASVACPAASHQAADASGGGHRVPEWRWLPGARLATSGFVPEAQFRQGKAVTLPGALASMDVSHRLFGGAPAGPRHGLLIGRLEIPEGVSSRFWWLRMSPVAAAVRIWLDGQRIGHSGVPAGTREQEIPAIQPLAIPVGSLSPGTHWLILEISGHHFKEAAVWGPVWLESGSPQDMPLLWQWLPALVQMGALVVTGIFLVLFGYRTTQRDAAWSLALFVFALTGRQLLAEHLPEAWFSAVDVAPDAARFTLLMRLEFTFLYLALWAYALTLERLAEPGRRVRKGLSVIRALALAAIGLVWLFPPEWFSLTGSPMQLAILAVVGLTVGVGWQAWIHRPHQRPVWLAMLASVVLPVTHDVLVTQFVISGDSWLGYGVLGLSLSLALLIARQAPAPGVAAATPHDPGTDVPGAMVGQAATSSTPENHGESAGAPVQASSAVAGEAKPALAVERCGSSTHSPGEGADDLRRAKLVALLARSLALWEFHTGRTKADLAEQSRAWRVYIDGGTAKTRTLDKYLSLRTLPSRPRWRQVLRTAGFVLKNCTLTEAEHAELSELIREVEAAYTETPVTSVTNVSETTRYAS